MKKSLLGLFLVFSVFALFSTGAYAAQNGYCGAGGSGTNASFTLDDSKLLTITGAGEADVYNSSLGVDRSDIRGVIIGDGITKISEHSFDRFFNLNVVYIPATLQTIPEFSFGGDYDILEIYYGGTETEWNQKLANNLPSSLKGKIMHYSAAPSDVTGPAAPDNPLYTIDNDKNTTTFHIKKHVQTWSDWIKWGFTEYTVTIELYNSSHALIASKTNSVSVTEETADATVDVDFGYILHVGDYIKVNTAFMRP